MSILNDKGQETFDQTPIEFPIKFDRPIPLHIRLREQILRTMEDMRHQNEVDTPEESDDFNVPDDPDMWDSPYELNFDLIDSEKFSAASKEEFSEGGSSDGAAQGEQSEPSSKKE